MASDNIKLEHVNDNPSENLNSPPKNTFPKLSISLMPDEVDNIVHAVISQYVNRINAGIDKNGMPFDRSELSIVKWMHNAQEELMENILYIEKLKQLYINKTRALAIFLEEQNEKKNMFENEP